MPIDKPSLAESDNCNPFRLPQKLDSNLPNLRIEERGRGFKSTTSQHTRQTTPFNSPRPKRNATLKKVYESNTILSRLRSTQDKRSVKEIISDKRELLLLNLAIQTQLDEINKLHDTIEQRGNELDAKEQELDESITRFGVFVKENEDSYAQADVQAEREYKKRQEKTTTVSNLTQQLQTIQADIAKQADALAEYTGYATFLGNMTPDSYTDKFNDDKRRRQRDRRHQRIEKRKELFRLATNIKACGDKSQRRRTTERKPKLDNEDVITEPDFEDEPLTSSDEECPMYFRQPQQLAKEFTSLEDENRYLLQKVNEREEELLDLRAKIREVVASDATTSQHAPISIDEDKASCTDNSTLRQDMQSLCL